MAPRRARPRRNSPVRSGRCCPGWRVFKKRPSLPATLYDVQTGARLAARLLRRGEVNMLHARGHVAALMAALAKRARRGGARMVFDIRGFMPEEYTDAGVWPEGGAYSPGSDAISASPRRLRL